MLKILLLGTLAYLTIGAVIGAVVASRLDDAELRSYYIQARRESDRTMLDLDELPFAAQQSTLTVVRLTIAAFTMLGWFKLWIDKELDLKIRIERGHKK